MTATRALTALAPDAALPARDVLLDPAAAAQRLETRLGIGGPVTISDAQIVRCKYRIGESLRVVLRVTVDGSDHTIVARAFRNGASVPAYSRAVTGAVPTGSVRPVVHDSELDTVWWTVPNDRRLTGLPDLLAPTDDMAGLAGKTTKWATSELVELAPERSATARALDALGHTIGYAKAYAPGTVDVAAFARRYDRVAAALAVVDGVSAPRALGISSPRDVLVLEPMPGCRWDELSPTDLAPALSRLGLAIATMHGVDPAGCGAGTFGRLGIARVVHSAELVAAALPEHSRTALGLARDLAAGEPPAESRVLLHGDCHPKNALAEPDGLALIDLDQGALGAAAADIGSLLARLRHGSIVGAHDPSAGEGLARAFLDGYARARALPHPDSLRWHTAAALVAERAIRAVNRVNRPAIAAMGDLLAEADRVLRHGALP